MILVTLAGESMIAATNVVLYPQNNSTHLQNGVLCVDALQFVEENFVRVRNGAPQTLEAQHRVEAQAGDDGVQ